MLDFKGNPIDILALNRRRAHPDPACLWHDADKALPEEENTDMHIVRERYMALGGDFSS